MPDAADPIESITERGGEPLPSSGFENEEPAADYEQPDELGSEVAE